MNPALVPIRPDPALLTDRQGCWLELRRARALARFYVTRADAIQAASESPTGEGETQ